MIPAMLFKSFLAFLSQLHDYPRSIVGIVQLYQIPFFFKLFYHLGYGALRDPYGFCDIGDAAIFIAADEIYQVYLCDKKLVVRAKSASPFVIFIELFYGIQKVP